MSDADYKYDLTYGYNDEQYAPLIGLIGQFLGYHLSLKKNLNADSPRHLTQAIVLK